MAQLNTDLETIKTARDNMKTALEGQGQTVTKDIRTYAQAIANISGGSGDVKLFDTIEHMQEDENPQDGDLAVVYREEIQPVTEESEFDSCIFPNTVILDTAFSDSIYGSFRSTEGGYFDGMVNMSSSSFRFDGYGEKMVSVEYTSQDGITYTRTDGGEELQEFGTTIKWEFHGNPFNSVIGNFMKINGNYFDGLYSYDSSHISTTDFGLLPISGIDITNSTYTGSPIGHYDMRKVSNILNNIKLDLGIVSFRQVAITTIDNHLATIFFVDNTLENVFAVELCYNEVNDYYQISSSWNYAGFVYVYTLDLANETYNLLQKSPEKIGYDWIDINGELGSLFGIVNISEDGVAKLRSKVDTFIRKNTGSTSSEGTIILSGSDDISKNLFYIEPSYIPVKTQLDTTSDYVYGKIFYGKNGVEDGTLTTNVSNSFVDVNAEVYAKLQQQYDNMQPRVLTDQDKTIDTNIKVIPCKSDGTLLLDTSNVTNMTSMFNSCRELKTIPLLDTSNVTNMTSMFAYCSLLTTIPLLDTSNVTNMSDMFDNCRELKTIPLLDTSNVTNMSNMFTYCSLLPTIPLFNTSSVTNMLNMFAYCPSLTTIPLLDTSNVTNMTSMFFDCRELTTIPLLDTSSVTNMLNMFAYCPSLSNESLNNILVMCIGATNYTGTKTLKYIGLSSAQATICQGLSNYSAFISAGWTTGY